MLRRVFSGRSPRTGTETHVAPAPRQVEPVWAFFLESSALHPRCVLRPVMLIALILPLDPRPRRACPPHAGPAGTAPFPRAGAWSAAGLHYQKESRNGEFQRRESGSDRSGGCSDI